MEAYQMIGGVVLFVFVLGCGVMSTIALLLITTNIGHCPTDSTGQVSAVTYLLISLAALELVNFVKNLILSCQRYDQCWPTGQVLVWLLMSSGFSTVGISTLLFYILPRTDLIRGLALLMSFGLLPTLLKTFILHNFKPDKTYYKPLFVCCLGLQLIALCFTMLHDYTTSYTSGTDLPSQRPPLNWTFPTLGSVAVLLTILFVPFQWMTSYIESDISLLTKSFALVSFRQQVNRCQHKFGLFLPLWKSLWIALCLYLFLPSYLDTRVDCTSQTAPVADMKVSQIAERKTTLERLLLRDEQLNKKTIPLSPEAKLEWRYLCEKKRDPTWIPPQNVEEVTMVKTVDIMKMVDEYIACTDLDSMKCEEKRADIDAIILPGRYSKQTIASYLSLISYVGGEVAETSEPEVVVAELTLQAIAIIFVCSSIVAMISAMAACQWEVIRFSYVIPACLVVPLSMVVAMLLCTYPAASLLTLLKCPEPWSASSLVLAFLCLVWSFSQMLFLLHSHKTSLSGLELSSDLSMPLTCSALVFAVGTTKETAKSSQTYRTYKFSYIKSSNTPAANGEVDANRNTSR